MSNKLAFFEGMSPEQKGALIGSLMGAGVGGLGGAMGSKKNKLRNSLLAALAGGAGGAGLGYLGGRYLGYPKPSLASDAVGAAAGLAKNPIAGLPGAVAAGAKNAPALLDMIAEGKEKLQNALNPLAAGMGEEAKSGPMAGLDPVKKQYLNLPGAVAAGAKNAPATNDIEQAMRAGRLLAPVPGGAGFLNTLGGMEEATQRTP
jgi:hypothetical protein